MFVQGCRQDDINFRAVVHPFFMQGPIAYAPLTYEAPAIPHILCFASVCRSWCQSVNSAVRDRIMVNVHHLLHVSHLRHDTSERLHRPSEDRF